MKKIIALVISLTIIISSCSLNSFATQVPPSEAQQTATSEGKAEPVYYIETGLLKYIGFEKLAKGINEAFKAISNTSFTEKSIILSLLATMPLFSSNFRKSIKNYYVVKYFGESIYNYFAEKFSFFSKEKEKTPEEALHTLSKELVELKGQKKAKKSINNIVTGIIYGKEIAKLKNKKYDHGDVIYIFGPSGVGKTFATERIAHALSSAEPFTISASEIDPKSKISIANQLFKFNSYSDYYDMDHSLVQYINNNKNGIVIINEYDKIGDKNLDEVLRTIIDQGKVVINGHVLDCSGITFIITSNESSSYALGGNQEEISNIDDGTGSRTVFKHDKSFMNRVKLIEFDNLSQEDYEEIINAEYGSEHKSYLEKFFNVKLDLGDTTTHVAKKLVKENRGTRNVKDIFDKLTNKLINLKSSLANQDKNGNPKSYLVSYNENTDEFSLKLKNS